MKRRLSESDFEELSWHDTHIYAIDFRVGDPDSGDWTSDLALDIDYICEWICGVERTQFSIAPADLVFHGVTDLRIDIDWGPSGCSVAPHLPSIDGIARQRVAEQKVYLDRPYYRWSIRLNAPSGGEITLGAVGFTQTLRRAPTVHEQQYLGRARR